MASAARARVLGVHDSPMICYSWGHLNLHLWGAVVMWRPRSCHTSSPTSLRQATALPATKLPQSRPKQFLTRSQLHTPRIFAYCTKSEECADARTSAPIIMQTARPLHMLHTEGRLPSTATFGSSQGKHIFSRLYPPREHFLYPGPKPHHRRESLPLARAGRVGSGHQGTRTVQPPPIDAAMGGGGELHKTDVDQLTANVHR